MNICRDTSELLTQSWQIKYMTPQHLAFLSWKLCFISCVAFDPYTQNCSLIWQSGFFCISFHIRVLDRIGFVYAEVWPASTGWERCRLGTFCTRMWHINSNSRLSPPFNFDFPISCLFCPVHKCLLQSLRFHFKLAIRLFLILNLEQIGSITHNPVKLCFILLDCIVIFVHAFFYTKKSFSSEYNFHRSESPMAISVHYSYHISLSYCLVILVWTYSILS